VRASVNVTAHGCHVRCPYEARHIPKSFPLVRWLTATKEWRLPAEYAQAVAEALEDAGCHVVRLGTWARDSVTGTWAEQTLAAASAVSPALAEKVFAALTRALHPDVGGDTRLMQQLNAARDELRALRRGAA